MKNTPTEIKTVTITMFDELVVDRAYVSTKNSLNFTKNQRTTTTYVPQARAHYTECMFAWW